MSDPVTKTLSLSDGELELIRAALTHTRVTSHMDEPVKARMLEIDNRILRFVCDSAPRREEHVA